MSEHIHRLTDGVDDRGYVLRLAREIEGGRVPAAPATSPVHRMDGEAPLERRKNEPPRGRVVRGRPMDEQQRRPFSAPPKRNARTVFGCDRVHFPLPGSYRRGPRRSFYLRGIPPPVRRKPQKRSQLQKTPARCRMTPEPRIANYLPK